jgi:hypothetical protein
MLYKHYTAGDFRQVHAVIEVAPPLFRCRCSAECCEEEQGALLWPCAARGSSVFARSYAGSPANASSANYSTQTRARLLA